MRARLAAIALRRCQRIVKIIAHQAHVDRAAPKDLGLLDLLLGRRDRHENHAVDTKVAAHKGNALRVIAGAGTNKGRLFGNHFAHRIERATQFVRPDRTKILAL